MMWKVTLAIVLLMMVGGCGNLAAPQPHDTLLEFTRATEVKQSVPAAKLAPTPPVSLGGDVSSDDAKASVPVVSTTAGAASPDAFIGRCRQAGIFGGASAEECAEALALLDRAKGGNAIAAKCASDLESLKTETCLEYVKGLRPPAPVILLPSGSSRSTVSVSTYGASSARRVLNSMPGRHY